MKRLFTLALLALGIITTILSLGGTEFRHKMTTGLTSWVLGLVQLPTLLFQSMVRGTGVHYLAALVATLTTSVLHFASIVISTTAKTTATATGPPHDTGSQTVEQHGEDDVDATAPGHLQQPVADATAY